MRRLNKLTVNRTKSSEALHSDIGYDSDLEGVHELAKCRSTIQIIPVHSLVPVKCHVMGFLSENLFHFSKIP